MTQAQPLPYFNSNNRTNNAIFQSSPAISRCEEATPLMQADHKRIVRRHSDPIQGIDESDNEDDSNTLFPSFHHHWLPTSYESVTVLIHDRSPSSQRQQCRYQQRVLPRSLKRRVFLFLTEPTTSIGSAIFFFFLILAITVMNFVMIMQTMNTWQFTPKDCITCGGKVVYTFEDDGIESPLNPNVPCVCPPTPLQWTVHLLSWLVYFFSVEWILRVVTFEPKPQDPPMSRGEFWRQWFSFMFDFAQILDALAIFPYYLETLDNTNGLMSLRLLRLFRVFQLLRLGQYNTTFMSLTNVLWQSMLYLKLLVLVLIFGAALFGSMMYWLEKGSWKYHEDSASYRFVRISLDGVTEEPTPFTSIPAAFWWFMVTATTVGYGDVYPTTTGGKWVATFAMLTGVLVVAFPVSVFSDLWSKEVKKINKLKGIETALDDESMDDDRDMPMSPSGGGSPNHSNHGVGASLRDISGYQNTKANEVDKLMSDIGQQLRPETSAHDNSIDSERDDVLVVRQDDLMELVTNLETMRASELRIRNILSEYQIKTSSQ